MSGWSLAPAVAETTSIGAVGNLTAARVFVRNCKDLRCSYRATEAALLEVLRASGAHEDEEAPNHKKVYRLSRDPHHHETQTHEQLIIKGAPKHEREVW